MFIVKGKDMEIRGISKSLAFVILFFFVSTAASKEGIKKMELKISSASFQNNGHIPSKYTCDGSDVNPPLIIENVPDGTKSLALIVDDPDAPRGTWVHWVLWNVGPATNEIKENSVPKDARQGLNDFKTNKYGGPCPPSGTHHYFFKLYALDAMVDISPISGKSDVEKAMRGHVIAQAHTIGLYSRNKQGHDH